MNAPYDISCFKEHTNRCTKSSSAASNTHTLHVMFTKQSQRQVQTQPPIVKSKHSKATEELILWPCPGLTELDNPEVKQYLERTEAGSAGGVSE